MGTVTIIGQGNYPNTFKDNTLQTGNLLYRLKTIDKDGSCDYSDGIAVLVLMKDTLQLYPNSATTQVNIRVVLPEITLLTSINTQYRRTSRVAATPLCKAGT